MALSSAAPDLLKAGLLYPTAARPKTSEFGHHEIAWSLMQNQSYIPSDWSSLAIGHQATKRSIFESLLLEIDQSKADHVIISSEELDCLSGEEVHSLAEYFKDFNLVPIVFLRNIADFIESAYRTYVTHSTSLDDIRAFAGNQRTRLDFHHMVRDWVSISQSGTIVLADYDDPLIRQDSLAVIRACTNTEASLLPSVSGRQNQSIPAALIKQLLFLRSAGVQKERLAEWLSELTQHPSFDQSAMLLPPDLVRELDDHYRIELSKLNDIRADGVLRFGSFTMATRQPYKWIGSLSEALLDARISSPINASEGLYLRAIP